MSIRIISRELQKKAEKELHEVPKRIQEDLEHIRHWITKQPHLNVREDDQWLLNFLRGCKFSLEKTKQKLDMYYTMRTMLPEFFSNRDPFLPEIQEVLKLGLVLPLSTTNEPDSPRTVLVRCDVDPSKVLFVTVLKTALMILDILLNEDDNFVIAGQVGLHDFKGMTLSHAVQVTPTICRKLLKYLQAAYPSRPKDMYFINAPNFTDGFYNVCVKPFLETKIVKRIHICNGERIEKIQKTIHLSTLPKEYGGDGDSLEDLTNKWKTKVESYQKWFLEDAAYGSDETKRIGEPLTSDCMFGIAGSFRLLDFD